MRRYQQASIVWLDVCEHCAQPIRPTQPHHHPVEAPEPSSPVSILTPAALGALWGMSPAKVRDLCRTGRIPAKKLGPKEWCIPMVALKEWARQNPGAVPKAVVVSGVAKIHRVVHVQGKGKGP